MTNLLIENIKNSLSKTDNYSSKITDEILSMPGMSGPKTRHFYNNLCSMNDARYLDTETSHYQALNHYVPCLDNEFIYLVDDWNHPPVREGTLKSIKDNKLKILYQKEIFTSSNNPINDWHNGISIFVFNSQIGSVCSSPSDTKAANV
jgi:hypothetical protein